MKFLPGEINIICTDINRSLHFYRDILGFEVLEEEEGCYHLRCNQHLFLLLPVAYCSIPTFSVDLLTADIEAANRYFKSHQIVFEREWQPGRRSFILRDPDGLVWEIIERIS